MADKLPFVKVWAGPNVYEMEGWCCGLILAPAPIDEQRKGFMIVSLALVEVRFRKRWPWVRLFRRDAIPSTQGGGN